MATNAVYDKTGSASTFKDANGTVTFTLTDAVDFSGGTNPGRASNVLDSGASPRPSMFKWEARIKWVATPTLGDIVRIYAYSTDTSGNADLTADGVVTVETKFNNFRLIGQVVCSVAADQYFYGSGLVYLPGRYIYLGVWNAAAAKDLNATSEACFISLTPVYPDIQAAS